MSCAKQLVSEAKKKRKKKKQKTKTNNTIKDQLAGGLIIFYSEFKTTSGTSNLLALPFQVISKENCLDFVSMLLFWDPK